VQDIAQVDMCLPGFTKLQKAKWNVIKSEEHLKSFALPSAETAGIGNLPNSVFALRRNASLTEIVVVLVRHRPCCPSHEASDGRVL